MIEEAAGTSMYESKRDDTAKLIEKKDSKINEISMVRITMNLTTAVIVYHTNSSWCC